VLAAKLPEITLLGLVMRLAGLVVAGDEAALRGFCVGALGAGAAVAASLAANLAGGSVTLGEPARGKACFQRGFLSPRQMRRRKQDRGGQILRWPGGTWQ
ncbi:MAG: hypothetical protein ACKOC9_08500, partial [Alphaproteobacteria bacterium]